MREGTRLVVAILGAESTGKTTLSLALSDALRQHPPADARTATAASVTGMKKRPADPRAPSVVVVPEYLREFCLSMGRTPRQDEQAHIAQEQTDRIEAASHAFDIVLADTTALMIAVYSDLVFGDKGLYQSALGAQSRCSLTLLMGLDLAWSPDGLQRDGPHVREPVDGLVRAALDRGNCTYSTIFGSNAARVDAATACVRRALEAPSEDAKIGSGRPEWRHWCERCDEAAFERVRSPRSN